MLLLVLDSIYKCHLIQNYNLILVIQNPDKFFKEKLKKKFNHLIIIETFINSNKSKIQATNYNIYRGFKFCFYKLQSEYVVHIEDDILVSRDFLAFINDVYKQNIEEKNFFAINGFSCGFENHNYKNIFSKFYFGIGKGWMIPKRSWLIIQNTMKKICNKNQENYFDFEIENFIRDKYFVVNPYFSRTLEIPSIGSNTTYEFFNSKKYKNWKNSFDQVKNKDPFKKYIYYSNLKINWRSDFDNYNFQNYLKRRLKFYFKKLFFSI